MIRSMTGYAAAAADSPRGTLSLELRSVNARFLDLQFRVAEELRSLEPRLRDLILARVARGKIDCRVFLNDKDVPQRPQRLNAEAIARLRSLAAEAQKTFPDAAPLREADVLRWPGVVAEPEGDEETLRVIAERLCQAALDQLVAAREREGAKLAASIGERTAAMRRRIEEVAPLVPQSLAAYQARLAERLREALGTAAWGAGKPSLIDALMREDPSLKLSVSYTTRAPRPGEKDGVDYHFVDDATFLAMRGRGEFLESAEVHGYRYGTSKKVILDALERGDNLILEIDWQGAQQVRKLYPDTVGIFILPPSIEELERRMRARGQDAEDVIQRRMQNAREELSHAGEFKYAIINNHFDNARQQLADIIRTERKKHGPHHR